MAERGRKRGCAGHQRLGRFLLLEIFELHDLACREFMTRVFRTMLNRLFEIRICADIPTNNCSGHAVLVDDPKVTCAFETMLLCNNF